MFAGCASVRVWVLVLLVVCVAHTFVCQAHAQDFTVELPLADAARVLPQAERVPGLVQERDALVEENAALAAQVARLETLAAIDEKIIEKERTLRGLAEEERDAYKERAERIAKQSRGAVFWSKVKERAAEGALVGSLVGAVMPIPGGPAAGIVGGALIGGLVGAIEGAVGGP